MSFSPIILLLIELSVLCLEMYSKSCALLKVVWTTLKWKIQANSKLNNNYNGKIYYTGLSHVFRKTKYFVMYRPDMLVANKTIWYVQSWMIIDKIVTFFSSTIRILSQGSKKDDEWILSVNNNIFDCDIVAFCFTIAIPEK